MTDQHETTILFDGSGITEGQTPTCSCGWVGKRYEAYNSWQFSLINDQINKHKEDTKTIIEYHE